MKRISIIINNILLSAGTERAVVNLAGNLAGHGYEVEIVSIFSGSGQSFYPLHEGVSINHLNCKTSGSLLWRLYYSITVFFKLYRHFQKGERIIIGTIHSANILLAFVRFFNKKNKYIGCEHVGYSAATPSTTKARKLFYRFLDAVVVLTQQDYVQYKKADKLSKCYVIPNQISFAPDVISDCMTPNLLAIGRLTNQKGFDLMLDVVAGMFKNNPEWRLTIIGEGEMQEQLEQKRKDLGLTGHVTIEPFTKAIVEKFLGSAIYLMTSRYEGLPMVLLEAKACGLPIITFDCPTGPRELINDNDGFLIPMNDNKLFREKLELLMRNADLRKQMGQNAFKNIDIYRPEQIFRHWETLFNQL